MTIPTEAEIQRWREANQRDNERRYGSKTTEELVQMMCGSFDRDAKPADPLIDREADIDRDEWENFK